MSYFLQFIQQEAQNSFLEKYSGILSAVLIIILFILERKINGVENKKQNKINWYNNVVIQPNLPTIQKFFFDYTEETKKITTVRQQLLSFSSTQRTLIKAKEYNDLQNINRNFEFDFLILVSQYDLVLYSELLDNITSLYDFVVLNLGNEDIDPNILPLIIDQIKTTKALFFSKLYQII